MKMSFLLVSLTLAASLAAGCGASAPVRLADLPKAAQLLKSHERPLRYSVAFAPMASAQLQKPKARFGTMVKADTTSMRTELAKALRHFEVFTELRTIEEADEAQALEAARKEGLDLLLTANLIRYNIAYDRGVRGAGTVIAWLFSPWLSWAMPDEVYTANIGLELALKRTADGSTLWQKEIEGKASCELDDVQRGLKTHEYFIGSIFTGPGSFNQGNYQKVAAIVGPHAMQNLQLNMIDEIYQLPQPPPEKKSFAIVVGINECMFGLLPKLKYAEADAAAFAEAMKKTTSPYRDEGVKLLTGRIATIEGLKSALRDFATAEHTEIVDFLVYFAGPGASVGGKHYLAFAESEDEKSMLSLEELHALVEGVKAKNRIIVLDTGFAGEGSRGLLLSGGLLPAFETVLTKSQSVALVCSCGPGQGGHEFKELGHGVFTSYVIQYLPGGADINRDKSITVTELVTKIDWDVQRYVRDNTVGQSQEPVLICDKKRAGAVIFKLK
jgi:hypothetical protein